MRLKFVIYSKHLQVYFDDLPEYGNDIYEPESGVVLEPIRPPQPDEIYYDEEEYVFNDYNDIPLAPPTPEPYNRREQVRGFFVIKNAFAPSH